MTMEIHEYGHHLFNRFCEKQGLFAHIPSMKAIDSIEVPTATRTVSVDIFGPFAST